MRKPDRSKAEPFRYTTANGWGLAGSAYIETQVPRFSPDEPRIFYAMLHEFQGRTSHSHPRVTTKILDNVERIEPGYVAIAIEPSTGQIVLVIAPDLDAARRIYIKLHPKEFEKLIDLTIPGQVSCVTDQPAGGGEYITPRIKAANIQITYYADDVLAVSWWTSGLLHRSTMYLEGESVLQFLALAHFALAKNSFHAFRGRLSEL